eukprot:GHVU01175231.1.p1 GENE.GHVU01175231.1~~GHVU01175231.1.p1  ORF type:complete len:185 (-),score=5.36 GHVU01175231.1:1069-1623(-)
MYVGRTDGREHQHAGKDRRLRLLRYLPPSLSLTHTFGRESCSSCCRPCPPLRGSSHRILSGEFRAPMGLRVVACVLESVSGGVVGRWELIRLYTLILRWDLSHDVCPPWLAALAGLRRCSESGLAPRPCLPGARQTRPPHGAHAAAAAVTFEKHEYQEPQREGLHTHTHAHTLTQTHTRTHSHI